MSRPVFSLPVAFGLVCAVAAAAGAEDLWAEFRGPTGQGHTTAKGLPLDWGPAKNIVWRVELPGQAWSSPVLAVSRIYVTNAVAINAADPTAGVSLRVLAVDARSGRRLWDTEVFQQTAPDALRKHDKNSHASPTVVYEKGRVYAHFGHHGSACLNDAGKIVWRTQENPYNPVHGTGGSPVLVDDLFIFNADGGADPAVIALDKASGKVRWKSPRPESGAPNKFSFCTPLLIHAAGRRQLITPGSGVVQSLDPATGKEYWRVRYGEGYSVVPRPLYAHGLVYVCSGYNTPQVFAIRPDGEGDVTATHVAWSSNRRVPRNPSPVIVGNELYMLDDRGMLSARDAKNGELHYEERFVGASSASLLAAEGRIYAIDELGKAAVCKPGKAFEVLAGSDLQERTLASMAVCGSDLLIRTEKALYRIGSGK